MKKAIVILFVLVIILLSQIEETNKIVIPQDAIRYRIIANSNSAEDQALKEEINKEIEPVISEILTSSSSLEVTRNQIKANIPLIKTKIDPFTLDYKINYGQNYFPEKYLYGIKYPAGNYESLVITLGQGLGDNWWCVLFPPLCLLEAKEGNFDEVTYTFYVKEILDRFY